MAADTRRLEHEVLAFAAEHRLVLETQVAALLTYCFDAWGRRGAGADEADAAVESLVDAGHLIRRELFAGQPAYCQIQRSGLVAIGCELPVPRLKLSDYQHDVGLAWLWLAARSGRFGPLAAVLGERRLRSHDGVGERSRRPYGIRLGGVDRWGRERLHYPDLLAIDRRGRWLALELELTRKDGARLNRILDAYGADGRVDAVLYVAENHRRGRSIARAVEASARRAGLADLIHVQLAEPLAAPSNDRRHADARRGAAVRSAPRPRTASGEVER